jgi:C4-dicarboxylate transporter DctM subunit
MMPLRQPDLVGVIVVMVVELGMIMPPIGINVFVINSLARDVPLWTIYKGVMPFILSDFVRLAILVAFPILSTFLPSRM